MLTMKARRRNVRNARWFAAYTAVMLALAVLTLAAGEISVGITVLAAALVFAWFTWYSWKRSRRRRSA